MTVYETVSRNQKQALSALHHTHEAVLDVAKPVFGMTEPLWRLGRDLPVVDRLPTAKETIEQWYRFFDDVLKEEKEFFLSMEELIPGRKVERPVVKSTTPKVA